MPALSPEQLAEIRELDDSLKLKVEALEGTVRSTSSFLACVPVEGFLVESGIKFEKYNYEVRQAKHMARPAVDSPMSVGDKIGVGVYTSGGFIAGAAAGAALAILLEIGNGQNVEKNWGFDIAAWTFWVYLSLLASYGGFCGAKGGYDRSMSKISEKREKNNPTFSALYARSWPVEGDEISQGFKEIADQGTILQIRLDSLSESSTTSVELQGAGLADVVRQTQSILARNTNLCQNYAAAKPGVLADYAHLQSRVEALGGTNNIGISLATLGRPK